MKTAQYVLVLLAAGLLACPGCKKQAAAPAPTYGGVVVDMPKFNDAFANASPEIQTDVTMVGFGVRYGDPVKSLMALDKLANNANLTEQQKKVVATLTEQVKQLAAQKEQQAPAAPAQ
jgi:hypothetical protein